MASKRRSTRSKTLPKQAASRLAELSGLPTLIKSWTAIGTVLVGMVCSYFGCTSPIGIDGVAPSQTVGWNSAPTDPTSQGSGGSLSQTSSTSTTQGHGLERDSVIIGSFNIQTFGRTKMSRPEVVEVLVDIARRFDILAIQELRDSQEGTINEFLRLINSNGSRYLPAVSERIRYGTGSHSEQLVFLYDSDQIELLSTPYVATDFSNEMFRPPYVGHFRCRSSNPQMAFSFVLINIHTSPQQTATEFRAMEEIIGNIIRNHPYEDDFILLGDMNEEPGKFMAYRWLNHQYASILSHWKTNTAETKNYDNIIFDHRRTAEFTGQAGVLNLKTYYQLSREQADRVSDHMPVWAMFSSRELIPGEITQQPATIR
jgi:deoxyribonuclease-1-like protein